MRGDVWISPSPFNAPTPAPYGYYWWWLLNPLSPMTSIDRFDFSNDTTSLLNKVILLSRREYHSGTSSESFGYFGGGFNTSPGSKSTVERLNYL